MCFQKGCTKNAYYNYPGEGSVLMCSLHKKPGMVNIKNRICEGGINCSKQPSFNYPDKSCGIVCSQHRKEGMINVKKRKCSYHTCLKSALYKNPLDKKESWCSEHKKDNSIRVSHSKKCEIENCSTIPSFNYPNKTTPIRCLKHKEEGMVNIKLNNMKCNFTGCTKNAIYKSESSNKKWCKIHKENESVVIGCTAMCKFKECLAYPSFGYPDTKILLRCYKHREEGMVDIKHKKCNFADCDKRARRIIKEKSKNYLCNKHYNKIILSPSSHQRKYVL